MNRLLAIVSMTLKIVILLVVFIIVDFPYSTYQALKDIALSMTSDSCVDELLTQKDPHDPLGYSILGLYPLTFFAVTVIMYVLAHYMALRYISGHLKKQRIERSKLFWMALNVTKWVFLLFVVMLASALYKIIESGGFEWVVMLALSMVTLSIALLFASVAYVKGIKSYLAGRGKHSFWQTILFFFYILSILMILTSSLMVYMFLSSYLHHLNYLKAGDILEAKLEFIELGYHFASLFSTFMVLDTAFTAILGMVAVMPGEK